MVAIVRRQQLHAPQYILIDIRHECMKRDTNLRAVSALGVEDTILSVALDAGFMFIVVQFAHWDRSSVDLHRVARWGLTTVQQLRRLWFSCGRSQYSGS